MSVRHSFHSDGSTYGFGLAFGTLVGMRSGFDIGRMRFFNSTPHYSVQTDQCVAIGAITLVHDMRSNANTINNGAGSGQGNMFSSVDLDITQIGAPYLHPVYQGTIATTLGASYVPMAQASISAYYYYAHLVTCIRLETGADRGSYLVQSIDRANSRIYLKNMDGSKWVAQATNASVTFSQGYRVSFFNETGVIPNSTGQVAFDGKYDAGDHRGSYIYRIHFEKSGSPSPAAEAQRGSYWLSLRGFLNGNGVAGDLYHQDDGGFTQRISYHSPNTACGFFYNTSMLGMSNAISSGMVLERTNQRLWCVTVDGTQGNSSVGYWNYKSPESFREVCSAAGAPNDPLPVPFTPPASSYARAPAIGSDGTVYVAFSKVADQTGAGWLAIKPDLSRTFVTAAAMAVPTSGDLQPCVVDTTKARTGTTAAASTTSAGHILCAGAGFASADLGRCIKLTGNTFDNGTYLIGTINGATDITVTNLNGSAVSFTGGSGGTFQIGDRIYLFSGGEATWNAGKMSWTDSLSFGTRFTKTVTMTAGAQAYSYPYLGGAPPACVDPLTGRIFWLSADGVKHLNMYDPAAQTVTQRPLSDLAVQVSGSNANPTAPTVMWTVAVNTNTYFRELWVGTDKGHYRFDPDNLSAQFSRFYGTSNGTYAEADGNLQLDGGVTEWAANVAQNIGATQYGFMPDGQVFGILPSWGLSSASYFPMLVKFNREAHNWLSAATIGGNESQAQCLQSTYAFWYTNTVSFFFDPFGALVFYQPNMKAETAKGAIRLVHPSAIHYQWTGSAWTPREVVRGGLPDSVSSPGCLCKPMHTTLDDLVLGVKVKFTSSGAVGGENGEFLGRFGQKGLSRTDGATVIGTNGFVGSGFSALSFTSPDVGRYYVRIESGADQGTYKILTYTNDTSITLQKFNGTAFSAAATAGTLSYSVWDMQAGAAVGPECCSVMANVGIGKDNTQDFTGIYADWFVSKTLLSEQAEAVKFCTDILPPVGSSAVQAYQENYQYDYRAAMGAHLALPGSPIANHVIDGGASRPLDGAGGRAWMGTYTSWRGPQVSIVVGQQVSVDLGQDLEIGSIIVRGCAQNTGAPNTAGALATPGNGYGGMIASILSAPNSGGAPAASSTVRCAGSSNLSGTLNTATITTTGDFMGSATGVTASDGATNIISIGASSFQSAVSRFSQTNVGMILKTTSGPDVGQYRILTVSGDGSTVTVRNLDQTSKTWSGTASGIAFTVYDGVQDEDLICIPSLGTPTYRLVVERLSNDAKTAYPRVQLGTTIASQSWQCVKPSWNLVKRISSTGTVLPPEVSNNGTFFSMDGGENFGHFNLPTGTSRSPSRWWKAVIDLSDLSTAKRTARWWKFAALGRELNLWQYGAEYYLSSLEFYDTSGKRMFTHDYCQADTVFAQPQMISVFYTRADFLLASNAAAPQYTGYNGTAILGGTSGNTVTLTGSNKFLGYQLRPKGALGTIPGSSNVFNGHANDPAFLTTTDVGRFLKINTGVNAGVYRIATVPGATQVTLVTINSAAVTLTADAGPVEYSIHEGINVGGANPDFLYFTTGGNSAGRKELTLATLSDDLTTVTVVESQFGSLSGQSWEIRRRALEDRTQTPGTNSGASARLLYVEAMYPYQSGDICQDTKGYVKFWPGDIGGTNKTAGVAVGGTANFQAASSGTFTQDDVGRILLITSGVNKGSYRISAYNSTSEVALVNHFTGAAVSLTGDASVTYTILGERRFRFSRYVTSLRS
jgi:hypothetical protein